MPYLYVDSIAVSEGSSFASFVVRLDAASINSVSVNYSTANGTAFGNSDVIGQVGTLAFAPGEISKTIQISLLNDTAPEPPEMFWLDLSSAVNATIPQARHFAVIYDNDGAAGTPAISVNDVVVDESGNTANFFVSLDRPSTLPVTVSYGSADDTAVAGQDYVAANGILNFAPGEMVKTVTVNLTNDALAEVDEFFRLALTNPSAATLADATGVATIGRNDAPPTSTPQLLITPTAAGENETFAKFVVQLSAPSTNEVRVNYSTANGTAFGNGDVIGQVGTLVFAPGETTKTVSTALLDDTNAEATEGFWFDLSSAVNATIPLARVSATIYDNDGTTGTPAISAGDVVVDEVTHNTAKFNVWLDRPSLSTVTVNYATADDTATAGADYVAAAGSLSFAPGEVVKTVTVNVINDSLAETNEHFKLLLSSPGNATIADGVGAGMIGLSDTAAVSQPQVLSGPVISSEGDTYADFLVQLSAPSTNEVRINYSTANGTAFGNGDVIGQVGTLRFDPGETTKIVRVLLLNDTTVEQTENFWFDLSSAVNATIPQARTSDTIIDNDGAVTYSYGISNDQYTVASVADRIAESLNGGVDTVRSSVSYILPDNVENLVLTGSVGLTATGNAGNNGLRGNSGNNLLDGQGGIDTAIFSGNLAAYTINPGANGSHIVTGATDGTDQLVGIERAQFADVILVGDTSPGGNTYAAYAMFNAGFNRAPTIDELSLWTSTLDRLGGDTQDLAQTMINHYAPGVSNEALVAHLWGTIVGGAIPTDALITFTGLIVNGTFTQASLVDFVASHPLNTEEIVQIVGTTRTLDPSYFPMGGGDDQLILAVGGDGTSNQIAGDGGEGNNVLATASSHGTNADNTFESFENFQTYEAEGDNGTVHDFTGMPGVTAIVIATQDAADTQLRDVAADASITISGKNQTLGNNSNDDQFFGQIEISDADAETLRVTLENTARIDGVLTVNQLILNDLPANTDISNAATLEIVSGSNRSTSNVINNVQANRVSEFVLLGTQDLGITITDAARLNAATVESLVVNGAALTGDLDLTLNGTLINSSDDDDGTTTVTLTGTAGTDDSLSIVDDGALAITGATTISGFETVNFGVAGGFVGGDVDITNFSGVETYNVQGGLNLTGLKGNEAITVNIDGGAVAGFGSLSFVAAGQATSNVLAMEFVDSDDDGNDNTTNFTGNGQEILAQDFRTISLDLGGDDEVNEAYFFDLNLVDENGNDDTAVDYDVGDVFARSLVVTGGGDQGDAGAADGVDSVDLGTLSNALSSIDLSGYVGQVTLDILNYPDADVDRNVTVTLNGYGAAFTETLVGADQNIVSYEFTVDAVEDTEDVTITNFRAFNALDGLSTLSNLSLLDLSELGVEGPADLTLADVGGNAEITSNESLNFHIILIGVTTAELSNENFQFAA